MIKNERQYRITKAQAERFEHALTQLAERPEGVGAEENPLVRKLEVDALRSQLADLTAELEEYEALRSGRRAAPALAPFAELPRVLIRARIAAGLTHRDLAQRLGLREQQVQQYEATDYAAASFARIREVMLALDRAGGPVPPGARRRAPRGRPQSGPAGTERA